MHTPSWRPERRPSPKREPIETPTAPRAQPRPATYTELAAEAAEQTRAAHVHVGALLGAIEHMLMVLASPPEGDCAALRSAVETLRARRRAAETALLDAQELADRALDALESGSYHERRAVFDLARAR